MADQFRYSILYSACVLISSCSSSSHGVDESLQVVQEGPGAEEHRAPHAHVRQQRRGDTGQAEKQQRRFREAQLIQREMSQLDQQYDEMEEYGRQIEQALRDAEESMSL